MIKKIQLIPSGITFIDETWGGLYRGGTYLITGPRKSGRTLTGLQFTRQAANQREICLYFTGMRPKDLMINAASMDFDLQHYMNTNQVVVIRVNIPSETDLSVEPDKYLAGYMQDIVSLVEQYQPSKIVFDELTPFIGYNDINKLKEAFAQMCEAIEDFGITSLLILGDPVSPITQNIMDLLIENSTGVIQLKKKQSSEYKILSGTISITPNIGHIEGRFKADYYIKPHEGIVVDFNLPENATKDIKPHKEKVKSIYKSLSEIETPVESYTITNFYNENDFHLILNNQIAYFKSTGQVFTLVSVLLDKAAIKQGLITISQLKNTVRLSTDRKDKICIFNNRVVVLIVKEDQKVVNNLIAKIKSNLPDDDPEQLNKLIQYISVYSIQVDTSINNADDLLQRIFMDKISEKK
jgi:circadian clock protein KaiC